MEGQESRAYACLGSNQGEKESYLQSAGTAIASLPGVAINARSSIYYTEPQGMSNQPFFANQVLELFCDKAVQAVWLLERFLEIEATLGRVRRPEERFGPRTIDIDLLLFGEEEHQEIFLTLPHPRMHLRAFVLVPLVEVAPDVLIGSSQTAQQALATLEYRQDGQTLYQSTN